MVFEKIIEKNDLSSFVFFFSVVPSLTDGFCFTIIGSENTAMTASNVTENSTNIIQPGAVTNSYWTIIVS